MSFPAKIKILFEKLKETGHFSPELAQKLCDIHFCESQGLQTEFSVLRDKGKSEFDTSGKNRRYYPCDKFSFTIGKKEYLFTNNWVERNTPLIVKFFEKYLDSMFIQKTLTAQVADSNNLSSVVQQSQKQKPKIITRKKGIRNWPEWETPSIAQLKNIAHSLTPYLKFLHPSIIAQITESNKKLDSYFREYLSLSGIQAEQYLWEKCSTMFPGIRRANGKTDNKYKKKQLPKEFRGEKKAIYIDDNSYPKHIWAFIFTGKQFSNIGPKGYELAHIFEHKSVERIGQELINKDNSPFNINEPLSGIFSCAAALSYAPRSFVKITDHSLQARRLLQRKAIQLYQSTTNLMPPSVIFKKQNDEWDINSFKWGAPVGDPAKTNAFLKYREERIRKILNLEIPIKKEQ